jgi:glycosyltransferase involved in cell wall biosynthesis
MEKNKKKLIVFIPSIEDGGVEKNLYLIINYISKKIGLIDLITFDNKNYHKFNKKINIINPLLNFSFFSGRKPKYILCLITLISKIILNRNYLILSFQANIYIIILAKIFNLKVISRSNSSSAGWSKNFFKQIIFSFFFKKANKILVNSFDFKKEMDKKYSINSLCILNPFDFKNIKRKSYEKGQKIYKKKNSLKIISVGRLTDQKDFLTLLKAIKILKNKREVELVIVGKGREKKRLEDYVLNEKLETYVRFIGYQKNPFKFIKQADIFILTSLFEGSPNVLVEALFLKKYVISTDCPTGPREILNNGKYGSLVKIGDYKEISKILVNYKKNKIIKKKINLGHNSLKKFSYEINCEKYLNLIKQEI